MIDHGYGVRLESLKAENIRTYLDNRNDPKIFKWCRQFDCLQPGQHVDWYDRVVTDPSVNAMYEITAPLAKTGIGMHSLVGMAGLTDIDRVNSRAEFSLYIMPYYHRRGLAKAALKTLFTHAFKGHNLNSVWGETFEHNPAFKLFFLPIDIQFP